MNRRYAVAALLMLLAGASRLLADTIPGGDVFGTWDAARSPYYINGEITVPTDSTLTLEPGVEVIFLGRYQFIIGGAIDAVGTEADSVRFTAAVPDTGWGGLRLVNSSGQSRLDYCVFEYGWATVVRNLYDRRGGAIYCTQSPPPLISHCSFRNNRADMFGGAVFFNAGGPGETLRITACDISGNRTTWYGTRGGGLYLSGQALFLELTDCIVRGNSSAGHGGGIAFSDGNNSSPAVRMVNCTLAYNQSATSGGGLYMRDGFSIGYLDIVDCDISHNSAVDAGGGITAQSDAGHSPARISGASFIGNEATGTEGRGGAIYGNLSYDGPPVLQYSTVAGNRAFEGGGIYATSWGYPVLDHVTIVDNTATTGGGIYNDVDSPLLLSNSILASNSPSALHVGGTLTSLEYCDFHDNGSDLTGAVPGWFGVLTGTNHNGDSCDSHFDIFLDPMLVDTANRDFRLRADSPCIDAGDPDSPRDPDSTITDLGAFYYVPTGLTGVPVRAASPGRTLPTVARGILNLTSAFTPLTSDISLLDATGRRVLSLRPGPNDVSRLAPGVYFVRAETPAGRVTAKTLILN